MDQLCSFMLNVFIKHQSFNMNNIIASFLLFTSTIIKRQENTPKILVSESVKFKQRLASFIILIFKAPPHPNFYFRSRTFDLPENFRKVVF